MDSFLRFKKNVHSQNGEDGIIEEIFNRLNIRSGNFIEFGAWDGKHLSNCYKLVKEGWSGIFIEGDNSKYKDLNANMTMKNITCLNAYVGYTDTDSLDTLIDHSSHFNKSFDFVSIDVDGLDYFIFDKFHRYLPKVICIEVSSGHCPLFADVLPKHVAEHNVGQSLTVMCKKGAEKGYFPLCYNGNLILIQDTYKSSFEAFLKPIEELYVDFLEHIVKPDIELARYLYDLYCIPTKHQRQFNQFRYVFADNMFMTNYLSRLLKTN
jgi:hypothetical protein